MKDNIRKKLEEILEDHELNQIDILSNDEVLEMILNYEGIQGYKNYIKRLITDIYNIELK